MIVIRRTVTGDPGNLTQLAEAAGPKLSLAPVVIPCGCEVRIAFAVSGRVPKGADQDAQGAAGGGPAGSMNEVGSGFATGGLLQPHGRDRSTATSGNCSGEP